MRLSQNFELYEFLKSQVAARLGIDMTPPEAVVGNLINLCNVILQPLRAITGRIDVSSGYRPDKLNTAIRGSKDSGHILGECADINSPNIPAKELFKRIYDNLPVYHQLILEFDSWVHVSHKKDGENRREALIATRDKRGRVTYTPYNGGEL